MLFEVFQDGERKFYTDNEKCVPSVQILESMKRAGCRFKLDGKAVSLKNTNARR